MLIINHSQRIVPRAQSLMTSPRHMSRSRCDPNNNMGTAEAGAARRGPMEISATRSWFRWDVMRALSGNGSGAKRVQNQKVAVGHARRKR